MRERVRHEVSRGARLFVAAALLALAPHIVAQSSAAAAKDAAAAESLITSAWMKSQIKIIAGDAMEGRDTGSPGQRKAAEHIIKELRAADVAALDGQGTYLQPWDLVRTPSPEGSVIEWRRGRRKARYEGRAPRDGRHDFVVLSESAEGKVKGSLVFVGYGITATEHGYDDYAGIDVKGKIVLALRGEPRMQRDDGWLGKEPTTHATFEAKVARAAAAGAAGLIVVTDPVNYTENQRRPQIPRGGQATSRPTSAEAQPTVPAVWIDFDACAEMLGGKTWLEKAQRRIDDTLAPASDALEVQVTLDLRAGGIVPTANIVAWIEGSDPLLAEEVIVLGAHYDHVGMKSNPSPSRKEDVIFNGADDNGSGTTTLLGIARALGKSRLRPRRSIVFLWFSGEELGLVGSEHYVAHPLRSIEKTVAMLNMDMVGRNHDNGCEIVGTQFSPQLRGTLTDVAKEMKLAVDFTPGTGPDRILERSDQAAFYKRNVPVAFFTTGEHSDYHKVSDHWDLIKVDNMTKIGRLILRSALRLADADDKPQFVRPD